VECSDFVHISSDERPKFDPKYKKCVFVGYSKGVKGFKSWGLVSKIINTTMVVFDRAFPNSMEVQVDLGKLLVIPDSAKACSPRPKARLVAKWVCTTKRG